MSGRDSAPTGIERKVPLRIRSRLRAALGVDSFGRPTYPSKALLASIVESSDDAIISKDLSGIVTSWNRGAEKIFGYSAEEMIGKPISVLAPSGRLSEMPAILERIIQGRRIEHYETVRQTKDGRLINISLSVSPIFNYKGRVIGASKIARDITERKLAEHALTVQAERLARSNADLEQFAYLASHDLQEPLRTIAALSELLQRRYRDKLDSEANVLINQVIGASVRMSSLIRDLLSFTRSQGEPRMEPVDTQQSVSWAINNLERSLEESGGVVEANNLPTIMCDPISIAPIFQNLISNAIKYRSSEPLRIRIAAEPSEGEWTFSVSDNGTGIDPKHHEIIFGLFKRLHPNRNSGTGIGLALCKKLVEKGGGRIWVESELGKGATFKFTVPRETPHE